MVDSIKTGGVAAGGFGVQFMAMLPEMVKVGVGLATIVYLSVKIYKEMRK
jgi:hypothetical protein|tara:strand:+ start:504 stop:653 length:150 start_codon:yes stop_codon:yes gene_type:complete